MAKLSSPLKLLITSFEPFGGRTINTSAVLAQKLSAQPHSPKNLWAYVYATLPVDFQRAWPALRRQLRAHRPDAVLLLGEKADAHFHLECVARNCRVSQRGTTRIERASPAVIGSRLNAAKILAAAKTRNGFSKNFFKLSNDAGTYLCNFIYYKMLSQKNDIPAFFVHVPAVEKEQLARRLKKYTQGLKIIRQELIKAIDGAGANYTSREN